MKHGWQLIMAIIESVTLKEASPHSGYSREFIGILVHSMARAGVIKFADDANK